MMLHFLFDHPRKKPFQDCSFFSQGFFQDTLPNSCSRFQESLLPFSRMFEFAQQKTDHFRKTPLAILKNLKSHEEVCATFIPCLGELLAILEVKHCESLKSMGHLDCSILMVVVCVTSLIVNRLIPNPGSNCLNCSKDERLEKGDALTLVENKIEGLTFIETQKVRVNRMLKHEIPLLLKKFWGRYSLAS
ncbi:hypothetical protein OROMI_005051 [Orobanche minor]